MQALIAHFPPPLRRLPALLGIACVGVLALIAAAVLMAQVSGERGITPVASSTDIEVRGISVNVQGDNAEDARDKGWHEAQRLAWAKIDGPAISDSQLESLVAAIVVEEESIGPRRYIAKLGVIFDRQRAGALLGADGRRARSAPMLTLPVMVSGGASTMFETRGPWQQAWAQYQFGSSSVDYVRPSGAGGELLLLTYGQTGRRSRAWWNTVLDQFNAADVLVPVAQLRWEWPGGPVEGQFTARYGPDNRYLAEFTMQAAGPEQLPAMLTRAVERFDEIYTRALADGTLRPDPTLTLGNIEITPEIRALLDQARDRELAAREPAAARYRRRAAMPQRPCPVPARLWRPRSRCRWPRPMRRRLTARWARCAVLPGVGGVTVTSTAIGGTSVLRISFSGEIGALATALRGRGWQVTEGSNALSISR